jgi:alpha-L-fucosidase
MTYTGDIASLKKHQVPEWFQDQKLGIFVHWGLYSVPGWATPTGDITKVVAEKGWRRHFAHNPYSEWYLNTMRIDGSPTQEYHRQQYGADFDYTDFRAEFDRRSKNWDPEKWAELFSSIGAGYVVHTSRHSDSFCLWPASKANPTHRAYHSERNIIGELTEAVRAKGLKMGIYYCGGMDWTFRTDPVVTQSEVYSKIPQGDVYVDYATSHWKELIDRYQPELMWNDIAWPKDPNLLDLFAYYYNAVPEGVINDRFTQETVVSEELQDGMLMNPAGPHYDFRTPEYSSFSSIREEKWESCRGIGHSFGYNRNETEEHYIDPDELIKSFVDIVSKNGNLLLNVGPTADGEIVPAQRLRLEALGSWLNRHKEGIVGSRPWKRARDRLDGVEVRYTRKGQSVYLFGMDEIANRETLTLPPDVSPVAAYTVHSNGSGSKLELEKKGGRVVVKLRGGSLAAPVWALRLQL